MTTEEHNRRDPELERLLGPTAPQLSCDECFEALDEYVELEVTGLDADARIPGMRPHLQGCPACHDEHESLLTLVAGERLH